VIIENQEVCSGYYRMRIACSRVFKYAVPGQFVMIRSPGQTTPLLSRPFSIHDVIIEESGTVSVDILYKIVGVGTLKLSQIPPGDQIDVLGPLGRGFSIRDDYKQIYMVAGGIGIAPFVFLGKHLIHKGIQSGQITLFIGGQTSGDLLCLGIFEGMGLDLQLTTDDGSSGQQSLVTKPLEAAFAKARPDIIYACGPVPMLREVMKLTKQSNIPCQVSIETMMACGMGACLGCAVEQTKTQNTYLHACKDGPVFDADRIIL
jgi:dihydroorotate dehydrogenase electron transfer subunit